MKTYGLRIYFILLGIHTERFQHAVYGVSIPYRFEIDWIYIVTNSIYLWNRESIL